MVKVVALTGTLADAGEHGVAAVGLGDVIDELHDDHGLAHASAAEGTDFTTLSEGRDEIDDLDAGLKDVGLGILIN